jgi:hypothetical protein
MVLYALNSRLAMTVTPMLAATATATAAGWGRCRFAVMANSVRNMNLVMTATPMLAEVAMRIAVSLVQEPSAEIFRSVQS